MRTDQTPCSSWEAWLQICNFNLILLWQTNKPIALIPACPKSGWWIPEYVRHLACKYQSGLWREWTGRGWDWAFFPKSPLARSSRHSVLGSRPYRGSTLLSKKQPSVEGKYEYLPMIYYPRCNCIEGEEKTGDEPRETVSFFRAQLDFT